MSQASIYVGLQRHCSSQIVQWVLLLLLFYTVQRLIFLTSYIHETNLFRHQWLTSAAASSHSLNAVAWNGFWKESDVWDKPGAVKAPKQVVRDAWRHCCVSWMWQNPVIVKFFFFVISVGRCAPESGWQSKIGLKLKKMLNSSTVWALRVKYSWILDSISRLC